MRPPEAGMPGLADRLNELFRTVRRPGGTQLWNNETAAGEISRSGPAVSAAYLSQLRTGKRLNPSARHLAALAGMFEVDMESFFPPWNSSGQHVSGCQHPAGHRNPFGDPAPVGTGGPVDDASPAAARVTTLLDGISASGVATIESAIAHIRATERLPPITPAPQAQAPSARPTGG